MKPLQSFNFQLQEEVMKKATIITYGCAMNANESAKIKNCEIREYEFKN